MNAKAKPSANSGVQIACKLTDEPAQKRREELSRELFWGCEKVEELDDGYEFVFPGGAEWATRIVSFLVEERECCPFFAFEMVFEPYGGPISLRIRGPKQAKEFIEEGIIYAGVLGGTEARVFRSEKGGESRKARN